MESILVGILFLHLLHNFLQASAFPKASTESFIIHYLEDRRIIPVKIELNANAQTEHVMSVAGETLYDFNLGKVAYKDLNSSQCFVADIVEESIEKDRRRLKNLQNGVVRGFYLPTFIIHKELNSTYNFAENFGIILAEFCVGNTISLVVKQAHRTKRDSSGSKGEFTHHSYGHYGHQSNNYAHYGHETYIKGSVDENGQIHNQQVNHQQIRSEGSHVYPRPAHGNGRQDASRLGESRSIQMNGAPYTNGRRDSATDTRTGTGIPQTQYQTQHRIPSYQQTFGSSARIPGIGGTGQFSLQSSHEGGYQLNLPLGLQAGNIYRGGVRSGGHYGVGGLQPQIQTGHQQYSDSTSPAGYQPFEQRQPLPPVSRSSYPSTLRGMPDADIRQLPSHFQPGTPVATVPINGDQRVSPASRVSTSDTQTSLTTSERRQLGVDYETQLKRQKTATPGVQITQTSEDRATLPHASAYPPSSISDTRLPGRQPGISVPSIHMTSGAIQSPMDVHGRQPGIGLPSIYMPSGTIQSPMDVHGRQPGIGLPSIHMPSGTIQSPMRVPGQISTIPSSGISDRQHVTDVSRPSQIHATYPDLISRQQYIPGSVPEQRYLQTPDVRQPTGFNGGVQRRPVPPSLTPGIYPGYTGITDGGSQQETRTSFPGSPSIPEMLHPSVPVSPHTVRNGARYPGITHPQTTIRSEYPSSDTYPGSRVPIDSPGTSAERIPLTPTRTGSIPQEVTREGIPTAPRPGERVEDSRDKMSIPSRRIVSGTSIPSDRGIISDQTGYEASKIYGKDSASSQTQVQTGLEGTAAEASAAGHYGGLGSQTQVQGGYAGNGSFSAQAQSGFTGGVVQSQVQGGKQGGLSGSSAQVERVGSAQSQVQVLKPSGSASSTAQGRFTGGTTQVQAQSSKTGGSAGAQAQSTGLSSSHAQVNVGGNDVSRDENFQGTVSASVHGGQSAGQSQTQLQGGYDSGRTYAATAQGGFDMSLGFQAGSLSTLPGGTLGEQQIISTTGNQETRGIFRGDHLQTSGVPISRDSTGITQQQAFIPPVSQTNDSRTLYPSSQTGYSRVPYQNAIQKPPGVPAAQSIYRGMHPSYPGEVSDRRVFPKSPGDFPGYRGSDERGVVIPGYPQAREPGISEQQTHFGRQVPEAQDRTLYEPGSQRQAHPSLPAHTLTGETDQHYIRRTPSPYSQLPGHYYPQQPSASVDSRYIPSSSSFPQQSGLPQQPGMQSSYLPPSHFPDQSQILSPSSQIIPPHRRPGEMPILTRPDGSPYIETSHHRFPMPDLSRIQPEQPQLLFPSSQIQPGQGQPGLRIQPEQPQLLYPSSQIQPGQGQPGPRIQPEQPQLLFPSSQVQPGQGQPRTEIQPQYPAVSLPSPQVPPEQTSISQPRPQIRPEQSHIFPTKPPIPATTEQVPKAVPSGTTEIKPGTIPGVSEPDKRDCCAALRDLKRRCCGGTSKQDKTSPCCRLSRDDIFDFSSEDDLNEDKEPCKVVKAICYIVYKPVGKARVCKPTETNGC